MVKRQTIGVDPEGTIMLEPIRLDHAPKLESIASDPRVGPPAGIRLPLAANWARTFCEWRVDAFASREAATFVVRVNDTEPGVAGCASVLDLDCYPDAGEFSVWLVPARWGRGIGSRVARALLRYSFDELGLERVHARCLSTNERGWLCLRRAGFEPDDSWLDPEGDSLRDDARGWSAYGPRPARHGGCW